MNYCFNCNQKNRNEAKFCGNCGNILSNGVLRPLAQSEIHTTRHSRRRNLGKRLWAWIPLTFVSAATLVVVATFFAGYAEKLPESTLGSGEKLLSPTAAAPYRTSVEYSSASPTISPLESTPSPNNSDYSAGIVLNDYGVPESCESTPLMAFANDLLSQMGPRVDTQVTTQGYSNSAAVLAHDEYLQETKVESKYKFLECFYDSGFDTAGTASYEVRLFFDSHPADPHGHESVDQQELKLQLGERRVKYFPMDGGFEYGTGSEWQVWVGKHFLEFTTWSNKDQSHFETINTELIKPLIVALK